MRLGAVCEAIMSTTGPIRREPRKPVALRVKVRMESWDQASSFVTRNLSRGGMFLSMPDAAPPGTDLQMAILLPDGSEVSVRGQIRHAVSRERAKAEGRRAGVGVSFVGLDDETKQRIGKVVDSARALAQGSTTLAVPVSEPSADESLLDALRAQLGEMKEKDYFGVLGVAPEATEHDIAKGFEAQLQRWDPERLADKSPEFREVVAEIVILLQEAHSALADAQYRAKLRERTVPEENGLEELFDDVPVEEAAERPPELEIEGKPKLGGQAKPVPEPVRLARAAREAGKFDEASKLLTAALAKAPGDRALLLEYHLTMGHGELSRARLDFAARHFDEVIRIDPQHAEAISEMRRISEEPRQEKRALLSRLFHRNGS